jgi:hypothetical protein
MAQVNSTPGQNQTNANAVVASASAEVGPTASTKLSATLTTVAYMQSEPGKAVSTVNVKRS